jgi:hypothetical protein
MGKKKLTTDNVNVTYDPDSWVPSDGVTVALLIAWIQE